MEGFRDDMRQCMDEFLAVPTDELHQGMVDAMQEFIDHPSCQMALGACVAGLIAGLTDRAVGDDTEDVTRHLNELPATWRTRRCCIWALWRSFVTRRSAGSKPVSGWVDGGS